MKMLLINLLFLIHAAPLYADSCVYLNIHFLYGSKPETAFKNIESKWFGGLHGGHVGIEFESNSVCHFVLDGKFRIVTKPRCSKNGKFMIQSVDSFYQHFGGSVKDMKKAVVRIPIEKEEYNTLLNTIESYLSTPPYDYALLGMRCASATSDLLEETAILPDFPRLITCFGFIYPKQLRQKLFRKAQEHCWEYDVEMGCSRRKWEQDDFLLVNSRQVWVVETLLHYLKC